MNDVNALKSVDTTKVWHRRLAHMSEKGMVLLKKKNVLSGMQEAHLEKCAYCLARKHKRVHFKSRHLHEDRILLSWYTKMCLVL